MRTYRSPVAGEAVPDGRGHRARTTAYPCRVSVDENAWETSHLTVVTPKEALERAQPLPGDDDMAVEGLTDHEWAAFEQALADR